ncbi:hypothetical protein O9H85_35335 [Paenibacillus filicis]|uniref:Uncharacterized protein n=1 Tax=Paenibacillus gyeongsangnamensis TaxID=3388067 RepID=A0ABT4QLD7_9BACL|nr:hypothetical protein [Paenibacillus filicis]MCZ8517521.1 hypothetical protein [Paenibacillus filicis]
MTWFTYVYWGIALALWIRDVVLSEPLPFLISLVLVPLIHLLLVIVIRRVKRSQAFRQWQLSFRLPWFGLVPSSYAAVARVRSLQLQLLFVTAVLIGCLYPWLPSELLFHLLFFHLWVMLPRLYILWRFRAHREEGYLIINDKDTSCYAQ